MSDDRPPGGPAPPPGGGTPPEDETGSPFASLAMQSESEAAPEPPLDATRFDLVYDVPVKLSVELGRTEVPIRDVINLGRGSIIELDRGPGTPLDVRVNGVLIGRGEVVLVNEERLGLRFVEVISQGERAKRLS